MAREDGENAALIAFAKEQLKAPEVREVEFDGIKVPYLAQVSGGTTDLAKLVDPHRARPVRRKGTAHFDRQDSFEDHCNRFKNGHSTLWAQRGDRSNPKLTAVLNYNQSGDGPPEFGDHRGVYTFPVTDEWKAWLGADGEVMSQGQFAAFIEEHLVNIIDPTKAPDMLAALEELDLLVGRPADLLQMSRGMRVHETAEVTNAQNLSSGETEFVFNVEHRDAAGNKLKVKNAFVIRIPIFQGGEEFALVAFLRYRVQGGRVSWFYALHKAAQVFDQAFEFACDEAKKATGLPLFYGAPEN